MFISAFAIRRPVVTIVATLVIVVLGVVSLVRLHIDEFPDVEPPVVVVTVPYPGATPEIVERELIEPLEERISGIGDVVRVTSSALDSYAVILVQFVFEKDMREATDEIRDEIGAIRNELPLEIGEPILTRADPTDLPIVSLTLSSRKHSGSELTRVADPDITRKLRGIRGVASVQVIGGVERELTVGLRPDALQAAGIGVTHIVQALQTQNLAAPVGRVTGPLEERTMRLRGRLDLPEDFEQLVVAQAAGRLVRLGDVADVRAGTEEPRSAALFDDAAAVGIEIRKAKGASTVTVADEVRRIVQEIQKTLPADVDLRIVRDSGVRVMHSVRDVQVALATGAALTVLVVFLFLNSWRSTVITAVALPISALASFVCVWAFGFTLNTMSLLGLSLAIGILIDDAIVVRENIVRHVESGEDYYAAAHTGTDQIGVAVMATTFAIVAVFVPVAFMGGVAEKWFASFALTIASSVLVSLFVSFSLDPMLSAYWTDPRSERKCGDPLARALVRFNRWFNSQADRYRILIDWALDHRGAMIAVAIVSLVSALALPALGVVGAAFLPVHDLSEFNVVFETPPGSNLSATIRKAQEIGRVARSLPGVAYTYTTIGSGPGLVALGTVNEGTIYVRLTPRAERDRHQQEIEQALRRQLQHVGGVTAWVSNDTVRNTKQIQVQLRGPDTEQLKNIAQQLALVLRQVPGAVDVGLSVRAEKPELDVHLDRPLAGALGVSVGEVVQALRPAFAGVNAGHWVDLLGETRNVTVRLVSDARRGIADVESLPIPVMRPQAPPATIVLGQVAQVTRALGPARIDHLDRERVIYVQANTEGRPLSDVIHDFNARVARVQLPPGYDLSHGGERQDQRGVFRRILIALGIGLVLMYLVHVVQFGSFLDPLPVIFSLPLSLIGAMLALVVTGSTLNIMSMMGLILLMGIVAKNAILLIDFAKAAERNGVGRRAAIIDAGRARLRPILMTTFALVAGMVPVALGVGEGADFRAPLGRAVIGGVLTSTLLTLLVIPSVYALLCDWRDRMRGRPISA